MSKICYFCRSEIPEDANECPYCPSTFEAPAESEPATPKKDILINLGFVMILLLTGGVIYWVAAHRPQARRPLPPPPAVESRVPKSVVEPPQPIKDFRLGGLTVEKLVETPDATNDPRLDWTFKGSVMNFLTLEPIHDARFRFLRVGTGEKISVKTNAEGSYILRLPPAMERGYAMAVTDARFHRFYRTSHENPDPGKLSAAARALSAKRLLADSPPGLVLAPVGNRPVETDFYLIPLQQ